MAISKNVINDLRKAAMSVISLSELCNERTKIETEALIGTTQTISAYELVHHTFKGKDVCYPIIVFDEMPDRYYAGGKLLTNMLIALANEGVKDEVWDSVDGIHEVLDCAIKVKFDSGKTNDGNSLTLIEIVD